MASIEELQKQEQELLAQLAQTRELQRQENERIAKEKHEAEEKQKEEWRTNGVPVTIESFDRHSGNISITTPAYRSEFVELMRTIKSRRYRGERQNVVLVDEFPELLEGLKKLQEEKAVSTIEFADDVQEAISKYLTRPRMYVDLDEDKNRVLLTVRPGCSHLATRFNARYLKTDSKEDTVTYWIVRAELPNIYEAMANEQAVEWSDAARLEVAKEVDKKVRLDEIALLDDIELDIQLADAEFEPRPFQRKGVAWMQEAGYKCLLADQMGLGKTAQSIMLWLLLVKENEERDRPQEETPKVAYGLP